MEINPRAVVGVLAKVGEENEDDDDLYDEEEPRFLLRDENVLKL